MPTRKQETSLSGRPGPQVRTGGACVVCRARKRKCSGQLPTCDQCKRSRIRCEWPTPQKRGIPKHLIRKFEARLARMESLLRLTLPFVSDDELESVLQVAPHPTSTEELKGTADPDAWEQYPLVSLQDVRAWQARSTSTPVTRHQHQAGALSVQDSFSEDSNGQSGDHETGDALNSVEEDSQSFEGTVRICSGVDTGSYPSIPIVSASTATCQPRFNTGGVQNSCMPPDSSSIHKSPAARRNTSTEGILPIEFKKEFLW